MAKREPWLPLAEMETALAYQVNSLIDPPESTQRFYSDLSPVPKNAYDRTEREFEEHKRNKCTKGHGAISDRVPLELGVTQTITSERAKVVLERKSSVGIYCFTLDIHYGFGLSLPLQVTETEAFNTIFVAKLECNSTDDVAPTFFKLPRELRDRIYTFAIADGQWQRRDFDRFSVINFAGGVGDPSGFYFPLSKDLTVLRIDKQMRREALPLAYRRTVFNLDDMDEFIKLAISIGKVGRDNIEILEFAWESKSDFEYRSNEAPNADDPYLKLPSLHVSKCIRLLKQCKRLKFLGLHFDPDLISHTSVDDFKADPGIRELCSVRGLDKVEIWDLAYESLEPYGVVAWLKEKMESPE